MILYVVLAVAVLVVLWAIMTYNGLVSRRAMVAEGWSGIDTQLKRSRRTIQRSRLP
jgi:LemA protein